MPPLILGEKLKSKAKNVDTLPMSQEIVEALSADNPSKEVNAIERDAGLRTISRSSNIDENKEIQEKELRKIEAKKISGSYLTQEDGQKIPYWGAKSHEYRYYIEEGKKGNCYRLQSFGWYLLRAFVDYQKGHANRAVRYSEVVDLAVSLKLHVSLKNQFMFLSRLRDVLCILSHENINVIEYNHVDFTYRARDEFFN